MFFARYFKNRCSEDHQSWHRNAPWWVLEAHLFCGKTVKGKSRESINIAGVDRCTLVSAGFYFILFSVNLCLFATLFSTDLQIWRPDICPLWCFNCLLIIVPTFLIAIHIHFVPKILTTLFFWKLRQKLNWF